ncbi:MAG: hypothetical protein IT381_33275 [Deltaproteobacteria bacterium]|nr:hypothetical protein [Deltaproteobacteria bacterium]
MTNWWPGLIALAAGLVIGAVLIFRGRPQIAKATGEDGEQQKLNARVDAIVEQLREMNVDRHLYDDATFATEVARLEREAAEAMRARDTHVPVKKTAPRPRVNDTGFAARHPQLIGALYGGGTVLFFAIAFFFVTSEQKPVANAATGDARYEAVLMLSAIAISFGDSEQLLQAWELYMRQPVPRRRPPQLQRAIEWLEKTINEE